MNDYILISGTRVLMPTEWEKLREAMVTPNQQLRAKEALESGNTSKANQILRYQIMCDMKLQTGMRDVEIRSMTRDWYRASRRVIVLPKGACKKERCTYTERTVMLSLPGCDAVDRYLSSGCTIPEDSTTTRDALRRYAEKAGIGTEGITPKMFRKTLASWLMACFPEQEMYISASMGHSREVLQRHYLGLGFPKGEYELIRNKYLVEWGKRL